MLSANFAFTLSSCLFNLCWYPYFFKVIFTLSLCIYMAWIFSGIVASGLFVMLAHIKSMVSNLFWTVFRFLSCRLISPKSYFISHSACLVNPKNGLADCYCILSLYPPVIFSVPSTISSTRSLVLSGPSVLFLYLLFGCCCFYSASLS